MSLANKYRPTTLDSVSGQSDIIATLRQQFSDNSIAQGILFCGPAGTGKTTTARIVANHLNAEIHELDAASNNGIDFVRTMQEEANRKSILANSKVFILDEVHGFSTQAWQAMLKILEEPPANTYFILCTTEQHKLPKTILSRLQKFYFSPVGKDEIISRLIMICNNEHIEYKDDAIEFIADKANGCMRDAISMLDVISSAKDIVTKNNCISALNILTPEIVKDFNDAMLNKYINQAIRIAKDVTNDGLSMKKFLEDCIADVVKTCENNILEDKSVKPYVALLNWLVNRKFEMIGEENPDLMMQANIIIWCGDNNEIVS